MASSQPQHSSLAELANHIGKPIPCAGNQPVNIDDANYVWFVESGSVNLFLIEHEGETVRAAPKLLLSREPGSLIPGVCADVKSDGNTLSVIAKGSAKTVLRQIPVAALADLQRSELTDQCDQWVIDLTATLSRFVSRRPRPTAFATPDDSNVCRSGVLAPHRGVAWVTQIAKGASLYLDMVDPIECITPELDSGVSLPLTPVSWVSFSNETTILESSTSTLLANAQLFPSLEAFHKVVFAIERLNRQLEVVDDANLERARTTSRRIAEKSARQHLFNIYDLPIKRDSTAEDRTLIDVLDVVGKHQGIDFNVSSQSSTTKSPLSLNDILDASSVRARLVKLKPEDNWWVRDNNAILAFHRENDRPVALLPSSFGRYKVVDTISQRAVRLNKKRAAELKENAWVFYTPLPSGEVKAKDLLKIASHGSLPDLLRLLVTGLFGGLIKLFPALALGFVANHVLTGGSFTVLYVLAIALVCVALLSALVHIFQNAAMMRLSGRSATRLEAAFWDRLMRLPQSVRHRYPTGDLAVSGMTFQHLRDGVQGMVADGLLSVIFLLPVFAVILFYNTTLGFVALGFSLIALAVAVVLGTFQVAPYGRMFRSVRQVSGRLFQIIGGISKLRVESAEASAFDIWASNYREQKRAELEQGVFEGHVKALGASLPFIAAGVILLAVFAQGDQGVPISDFLVVYMVFLTFQYAIGRFGESYSAVAGLLPSLQQLGPILSEPSETESTGDSVEYVGGEILFDRISFRYDMDGPLVLNDVTISAQPGELIAIAGESGSGKSTLFRLALGIVTPTAGAVYYDGRDLRHLNLKQLRRLIGAVPQSVGLYPQDIWDNVVSHHVDADTDEVWQAARVAEIETAIKGMPMGMMTMVGASGAVFSGGESQRITIARSAMGSPKVMLFDEATNWLDNENQAAVMRNLTELTSTRIVIAHRLSTLEQADRIYVLRDGQIVESGSFKALLELDGYFKELVQRQLV